MAVQFSDRLKQGKDKVADLHLKSWNHTKLLMAGIVVLLAASAAVAVLIFLTPLPKKHDPSQDRQYSEKGIDEGSQFRYSPDNTDTIDRCKVGDGCPIIIQAQNLYNSNSMNLIHNP